MRATATSCATSMVDHSMDGGRFGILAVLEVRLHEKGPRSYRRRDAAKSICVPASRPTTVLSRIRVKGEAVELLRRDGLGRRAPALVVRDQAIAAAAVRNHALLRAEVVVEEAAVSGFHVAATPIG